MQTFTSLPGLTIKAMKRLGFCVLAVMLSGTACGGGSPVAPDTQQPPEPAVEFATISGRVYARVDWGDPLLAESLVEVKQADGSAKTTLTDAEGFYEVSARAGTISITASKEGYEAKTWELTLLKDTVLNFGLTPK